MNHENTIAVVEAWQEAMNQQDTEAVLAVSDPNIEIVGPRGSAFGHEILSDWLSRAGLTLMTAQLFTKGDTVVAAQHGVWHSVETGAFVGEADVASRFRVADGRVTQYARYDDLEQALAEAGLTEDDAV